ncbi:hypothetical protein G5B40_12315 [Pikeienuella piscinae]|uniref:DUF11 domain-containing protein n=1 Tax=Pikeienuella piscinae TaxID=2748098 RepID=A0A7L5C089_9RHOB|nr:hypothetical protein [Pikeienuella piscinae]QIE56177.1 hypothetical protein G5B40_12315 [Pikeienuella piscinae]
MDHVPVLRVEMNGQTYFFQFNTTAGANDEQELAAAFQGDGSQDLTFFLSAAVRNAGAADETLYGDLFLDDGQQGPTRMTLTYYALIEENYRNGDAPVVVSDTLGNTVTSTTFNSQTSGNAAHPDGSSSSADIAPPDSTKAVVAINGQPPSGGNPVIAPGDEITYSIRIEVTSADVNDLNITDYLPAPVYDVDGNGSGFVYVGGMGAPTHTRLRSAATTR